MQTRSSRILLLVLGLTVLCLSACATSPERVGSRGTDLEVMRLGVRALAQPREPQGAVTKPEDAATTEQAWNLLLELDDIKYLSNGDKARIATFVDQAVTAIQKSRQLACRWYQFSCKKQNREKAL